MLGAAKTEAESFVNDVQAVGVVGAGTMGAGIAQLLVQNGIEVRLYDVSDEILSRAEKRILQGLERAEKPGAFSLLRKTTKLDVLDSCDLIIEAAVEDLPIKQELFRALDALIDPDRVLATNTSSMSVEKIAAAVENPRRVVGMHFFNPAPIMRLVEIVRASRTGEAVVSQVVGLAKRLGKTPVVCRDTPGFIVNRVARPFYLAGARLLEQGAGAPSDIDRALRDAGFRMGPLELMDLIGLDVNLTISRSIYQALGSPERLIPPKVQAVLVERGRLGRKSGRGFYVYEAGAETVCNPELRELIPDMGKRAAAPDAVRRAVLGAVFDEAKLALAEEVADERGIDTAMRLGLNWPQGPFEWDPKIARG